MLSRRDQGGSGGTNKMVVDPPPCYPHLRTFPPPADTQGHIIRGRQDLCWKPEPHLTQIPYKGISSYHPIQTQPLTPPHLKSSQVLPLGRLLCPTSHFLPPLQAVEPRLRVRVHPIKSLPPPIFAWPLYFISLPIRLNLIENILTTF